MASVPAEMPAVAAAIAAATAKTAAAGPAATKHAAPAPTAADTAAAARTPAHGSASAASLRHANAGRQAATQSKPQHEFHLVSASIGELTSARPPVQARKCVANPRLSRKCRSVCASQSGDCHQFPPLELAGCTRFAPRDTLSVRRVPPKG